jgi:hypothetical protein
MKILKSIKEFLIGKDPDIFDDKGNVLHNHPKRKWDDWQNKYIKSNEYNWRKHTGTKAGSDVNTVKK